MGRGLEYHAFVILQDLELHPNIAGVIAADFWSDVEICAEKRRAELGCLTQCYGLVLFRDKVIIARVIELMVRVGFVVPLFHHWLAVQVVDGRDLARF